MVHSFFHFNDISQIFHADVCGRVRTAIEYALNLNNFRWGDRSQLTTIILGARESIVGVIIGGVLGHALCTGIAVVFGRMLAKRLSVRTGEYS